MSVDETVYVPVREAAIPLLVDPVFQRWDPYTLEERFIMPPH
jgi:hypothetical protein